MLFPAGKDYPTYGINILCKINPRNPGCGGGGGGRKAGGGGGNGGRKGTGGNGGNKGGAGGNGGGKGGARAGGNGGGAGKRNGQNGAPADSTKNRNNKGAKADYEAQIAQGNIPGTAGKVLFKNSPFITHSSLFENIFNITTIIFSRIIPSIVLLHGVNDLGKYYFF